jgi:hypothetical protein
MQISRVVTGSDGRSHFEDEDLVFEPQGPGAEVSAPIPVRSAVFRRSTPEADEATRPLHPSRQRLLVVKLSGRMEIEVGDGSSRIFGPGSVHFLEDESGEGHRGRMLSEDSLTLILELAPEERT